MMDLVVRHQLRNDLSLGTNIVSWNRPPILTCTHECVEGKHLDVILAVADDRKQAEDQGNGGRSTAGYLAILLDLWH